MKRSTLLAGLAMLILLAGTATAQIIIRIRPGATPPPPAPGNMAAPLPPPTPITTVNPKMEAIAETKLLMEALVNPNYRALEKTYKERPADAEAWAFTRGQALLIAESGNLLMLRPPKTRGQDVWMTRATELRETATELAKQAAAHDLERTRAALIRVSNSCNRCHETFRVTVRVNPAFPEKDKEKEPGLKTE